MGKKEGIRKALHPEAHRAVGRVFGERAQPRVPAHRSPLPHQCCGDPGSDDYGIGNEKATVA